MKQWKCLVCGHVFDGDAPPVPCPVCGAGAEAFEPVRQTASRWRCTVCGQVFSGDGPPVPCPVCGAGENAFEAMEAEATAYKKDTDDAFVIVGGGLAALEAARAIRKRNATASVTILSGEAHCPYNRPALGQVIADGLSLASLLLEPESFYPENDIDLRRGVVAESIDTAGKTVALSGGGNLPYTKLLLATGAKPFNPIKSGHGSVPVKVLRNFEDATDLAAFCGGKSVVLVGGGILGLEAAMALREHGAKVTVVEFASRILPLQTDPEVSYMLERSLKKLGIGLITDNSVTEATGKGVVLSDGTELPAELVLASMGVRSEVSLAVALGLELGRGIIVDRHMHTSHEDIWAAGDCAEYDGKVQALAGAASAMGAVAGASMCGDEQTPYQPFVPATAFEIPGFSLFSAGAVAADPDESFFYGDKSGKKYRRLLFTGGRLTGALYVGGSPGAAVLRALAAGEGPQKALPLLVL